MELSRPSNRSGWKLEVMSFDEAEKQQIIRMGLEPFRLGLFTSIPRVEFEDSYPNRVFTNVGGELEVPFIGINELKINQATCARDKDQLDLKALSNSKP